MTSLAYTKLVFSILDSESDFLVQAICLIITTSIWRLAKGRGGPTDMTWGITGARERTRSAGGESVSKERGRKKGKGMNAYGGIARAYKAAGVPMLTPAIPCHRRNNPDNLSSQEYHTDLSGYDSYGQGTSQQISTCFALNYGTGSEGSSPAGAIQQSTSTQI